MYYRRGGTYTFNDDGTMTLSSGRFMIGMDQELAPKDTSATDEVNYGVLDLSSNYKIIIEYTGIGTMDTAKNVPVYVDNNSSNADRSQHGSSSRLYSVPQTDLPAIDPDTGVGVILIESTVGTPNSFIQIRTEGSSDITLKSITVEYQ